MSPMMRVLVVVLAICATSCSASSDVIKLTKKNFAQLVFAPGQPFVVEFFAPWCGHCKQLAPIYAQVATKLKGLVGVGAVDCDVEKELCGSFQIRGFPTIKLFGADPNKKGLKDPEDYQGARSVSGIANAGLNLLHARQVTVVSGDQLASSVGSGKAAILFSAKEAPSNLFMALSMRLTQGGIRFFLVPEKKAGKAAADFGVTKYPTLVLANADGEGKHATYTGKPSALDMLAFLAPHATTNAKKGDKEKTQEKPQEKPQETWVVEEVTSAEQWEARCTSKAGLCGVAFLDPEEDPERHKRQVEELKKTSDKIHRNVRVMWIDGAKHSKFFEQFRLGGGFPNFALYQTKLKRVVPFKGSFNSEEILTWIQDVALIGKAHSFEADALKFE